METDGFFETLFSRPNLGGNGGAEGRTMEANIFDFWSGISREAYCHPEDDVVFRRTPHQFRTDCLPYAFFGPLKTAPIVLLFLSPGFQQSDFEHGRSAVGRTYYERQRTGTANLPTEEEHESAYEWWTRILRQFGAEQEAARRTVAFLNMGAYKSTDFKDWHLLTALPSSRVALSWAQSVLFPQAEAGERLVICLRSPKYWGLATNADGPFGSSLYAPPYTRGGIMCRGALRDQIVAEFGSRLGG